VTEVDLNVQLDAIVAGTRAARRSLARASNHAKRACGIDEVVYDDDFLDEPTGEIAAPQLNDEPQD